MTDSKEQYKKLKAVLLCLSEESADECHKTLNETLDGEPILQQRVLNMLAKVQREDQFLENGLSKLVQTFKNSVDHDDITYPPGSKVGPFVIERKVGKGSMGSVYQANQTDPVRRQVALKIVSHLCSEEKHRRFLEECQTQAQMAHPNVATILEVGQTSSKESYAAIEWVDGYSIISWCRLNHSSPTQRITLVRDACLGLAHAHENGTLHRDIKPANILITVLDGKPIPKIIDFSISSTMKTESGPMMHTDITKIIGTPGYMSPEALSPNAYGRIDVRSDVFSLGVVLYELLLDCRPSAAKVASGTEFSTEHEVLSQGQVFDQFFNLSKQEQIERAHAMGVSRRKLLSFLNSDIRYIAQKSVAKLQADRYDSVKALYHDLNQFLQKRPIRAHPLSFAYIAKKQLYRHWIGISAAAGIFLILTIALLIRNVEIEATQKAKQDSAEVSSFLTGIIENASPFRLDDGDVDLQEVFDKAILELDMRFANQPELKIQLMHRFGSLYSERGQYLEAIELLKQALQLSRQDSDTNIPTTVKLMSDLGFALAQLSKLVEAEDVILRGKALVQPLLDSDPLLVAEMHFTSGVIYFRKSDFESAEIELRKALLLRQNNLAANDPEIGKAAHSLANVFLSTLKITEAEKFEHLARDIFLQSLPTGHPRLGYVKLNLGVIYSYQRKFDQSLEMYVQAINIMQARLGTEHPSIATVWRHICSTLTNLGRVEEALDACETRYKILQNTLGMDVPYTLLAARTYYSLLGTYGQFDSALFGLQQAIDVALGSMPENLELLRYLQVT